MASGVVEIPLAGTHLESGKTPFFLGSPFALPEFVVGPENHLVEAVVSAILDGASQSYSPLVVCGPTSSGKTHLVGGLFHAWKNAYPRRPALFVTASDFAREFREAVETKMEDQFHAPYARAQLLVLDNLEQLAGRHPAQKALTAMIDRQASSGGWVVVTSRSPPSQIPGLVAGLQARLTAGLLLRLALPGVETRAAILNRVAELRHLNVAETVLQTLAEGLVAPVPELIGALVQLEAEARLEGLSPTVAAAKRLLAARRDARQPTLATVAKIAAKHYGVSVAHLPTRLAAASAGLHAEHGHVPRQEHHAEQPQSHRRLFWQPRPHHRFSRLQKSGRMHGIRSGRSENRGATPREAAPPVITPRPLGEILSMECRSKGWFPRLSTAKSTRPANAHFPNTASTGNRQPTNRFSPSKKTLKDWGNLAFSPPIRGRGRTCRQPGRPYYCYCWIERIKKR